MQYNYMNIISCLVLQHLGNLPPPGGDFQEMICDACMTKCSFLQAYLSLSGKMKKVLIFIYSSHHHRKNLMLKSCSFTEINSYL